MFGVSSLARQSIAGTPHTMRPATVLSALLLFLFRVCVGDEEDDGASTKRQFPEQFFFGVSTASYQIEGAWNSDGKGENIWDRLTHATPERVVNGDNGDVACDSYNQYQRDVDMVAELGVDFYRFSLSWSRLLPDGFADDVNVAGVQYYNNLIDALLAKNVQPLITLYHWDLPQPLQDLGGWTNPLLATYFEDYAKVAFEQFGDRVKHWITFNEPRNFCVEGYGGATSAPGLNASGVGEYMCGHTVLQAHGRAYRLYDEKYRKEQKGSVGITLDVYWIQPATTSKKDEDAAERGMQFMLGWFAHPLFSQYGDYPPIMKSRIAKKSDEQGFARSRLPRFTESEIKLLRGSADFMGLNHYSTIMAKEPVKDTWQHPEPSYWDDAYYERFYNETWPGSASSWLKVVPWGFKKILMRISEEYGHPEILVTENGFSTKGGLNDQDRVLYIKQYLNALLDAIEEDCKVSAYTYWSLMDNFEWLRGYSERFGLYEVDFKDRRRKRTPRASAKYFAEVIKNRSVDGMITCYDCDEHKPKQIDYNAILI